MTSQGVHHEKIHAIEALAAICSELRSQGRTIAHCHGAFDLLHPGHIRHLQAARAMADVLVVTLTEDRFIRKGPGRPVYNERLRLDTIASIECVDFVASSPWPTAVETIELIQPTFYVKGQDYKDRNSDLTGAIVKEENVVKKHGGTLAITEEIQFSSTKLLNQHFGVFNELQRNYLTELHGQFSAADVLRQLDNLRDLKVLVIGEAIIDEYHYCVPDARYDALYGAIYRGSPAVSARLENCEVHAGGVELAGNHLLGLVYTVNVLACVGHDGYELCEADSSQRASCTLVRRNDAPTVRMRRFVDRLRSHNLFEVAVLDDRPMPSDAEQQALRVIDEMVPDADAVLLIDFGHGMFTQPIIERVRERSKFLAVSAQINSSNQGFNTIRKYKDADFISVDEHEIRIPYGDRYGSIENLIRQLADECNCRHIHVSLGKDGTIYFDGDSFNRAPVLTSGADNAVGVGDAILALTSLLVQQNVRAELVPFVGSCVGGLMASHVGPRKPMDATDLKKFITTLLR